MKVKVAMGMVAGLVLIALVRTPAVHSTVTAQAPQSVWDGLYTAWGSSTS
jgi:hypothetical protein